MKNDQTISIRIPMEMLTALEECQKRYVMRDSRHYSLSDIARYFLAAELHREGRLADSALAYARANRGQNCCTCGGELRSKQKCTPENDEPIDEPEEHCRAYET